MPHTRAARVIPFLVFIFCSFLAIGLLATRTVANDDSLGPELSGTYPISGTFGDGSEYTGTLEISKRKLVTLRKGPSYNLWAMKFHYSTKWEGIGMGLWIDNRLCFVMAHEGKGAMVSVFRPLVLSSELEELRRKYREAWRTSGKHEVVELKGDPWYGDVWGGEYYGIFACLNGDWGSTSLTFRTKDTGLGEGDFDGAETFYSDKGKNLSLISGASFWFSAEKQEGDAFKILRHPRHGGKDDKEDPWVGIALQPDPQTFVVVTGGNDTQAAGYFEVDGKTLVGHIADQDSKASYKQIATVPDKVLQNSSVFH